MKLCNVAIERCPNCLLKVIPGGIRWSCDDVHPEVLTWLFQKDDQEEEDKEQEITRDIKV